MKRALSYAQKMHQVIGSSSSCCMLLLTSMCACGEGSQAVARAHDVVRSRLQGMCRCLAELIAGVKPTLRFVSARC